MGSGIRRRSLDFTATFIFSTTVSLYGRLPLLLPKGTTKTFRATVTFMVSCLSAVPTLRVTLITTATTTTILTSRYPLFSSKWAPFPRRVAVVFLVPHLSAVPALRVRGVLILPRSTLKSGVSVFLANFAFSRGLMFGGDLGRLVFLLAGSPAVTPASRPCVHDYLLFVARVGGGSRGSRATADVRLLSTRISTAVVQCSG